MSGSTLWPKNLRNKNFLKACKLQNLLTVLLMQNLTFSAWQGALKHGMVIFRFFTLPAFKVLLLKILPISFILLSVQPIIKFESHIK